MTKQTLSKPITSLTIIFLLLISFSHKADAAPATSLVRSGMNFCESVNEKGYFPPLSTKNRKSWVNPNRAIGSGKLARKLWIPYWDHLGKGIAGDFDFKLGESLDDDKINQSFSDSASVSGSLHSPSLDSAPGSNTSTFDKPFKAGISDTILYQIPGVGVRVCQVNSRPKVEYKFSSRKNLVAFFNSMSAKELSIRIALKKGEQLTEMATGGIAITKIFHKRNQYIPQLTQTFGMVNDYFPAPVVIDRKGRLLAVEFVKTGYNTFRIDTDFQNQDISFPIRVRFGYSRVLPEDIKMEKFYKSKTWKARILNNL